MSGVEASLVIRPNSAPVALEVGKVERVDTSTMQLLSPSFARARAQRTVEWTGDTRVIRDAARLIGVESMLALPASDGST